MDKIIEKLIELMPLWTVIIIAIMFVVMKFYYTWKIKPNMQIVKTKTIRLTNCLLTSNK